MTELAKYVRLNDLCGLGIVIIWTMLRRWIKAEHFPPGRMIRPNTRAWTVEEIETFQRQFDTEAASS